MTAPGLLGRVSVDQNNGLVLCALLLALGDGLGLAVNLLPSLINTCLLHSVLCSARPRWTDQASSRWISFKKSGYFFSRPTAFSNKIKIPRKGRSRDLVLPSAATKLKKNGVAANRKDLYPAYYKVLALVVFASVAVWQFILLFKLYFEEFTMLTLLDLTTAVLKVIKQLDGKEVLEKVCFDKGISFSQT